VSIDKINKPFLPVASGEMTIRFAWLSVRCLQHSSTATRSSTAQVLALAAAGGTIVVTSFGSLIAVRHHEAGAPIQSLTLKPSRCTSSG